MASDRVIDLSARKERAAASLRDKLTSAYVEAKKAGSGPGVPRGELMFAERKRN